jgi:hypothetical protein
LAGREINEHIGRLDVLMDEAMFVYMAQCSRQTRSDAQKPSDLHRLAEKPGEGPAPRVLKEQHGPPLFAQKRQWPRR